LRVKPAIEAASPTAVGIGQELVRPMVYALARLTQPIVLLVHHFSVSFYWVLLANAVTYALVGLIVETLRQRLNRAR
jgi:hypothetical protein